MSEAATVEIEAQKSQRKSTRVKKEVTKYEEKPSKKVSSGATPKTRNSNGVAVGSTKERKVATRSRTVKHSAKNMEDRTDGAAAIQAVARTPGSNSRVAVAADGKGKEKVVSAVKAERTVGARTKRGSGHTAASAAKADEAVAVSREQDKASGAISKANRPVTEKSKTPKPIPTQKEVSRHSSGARTGSRRATFDRKPPSRNSNSRKSRKGPAHSNSCSTCSEDSYSDESHSERCSTCSDYDASSDGRGSISCSCSDCEFEDRIRGKKRPAPKKKTPKVVKEYTGIYTPD